MRFRYSSFLITGKIIYLPCLTFDNHLTNKGFEFFLTGYVRAFNIFRKILAFYVRCTTFISAINWYY